MKFVTIDAVGKQHKNTRPENILIKCIMSRSMVEYRLSVLKNIIADNKKRIKIFKDEPHWRKNLKRVTWMHSIIEESVKGQTGEYLNAVIPYDQQRWIEDNWESEERFVCSMLKSNKKNQGKDEMTPAEVIQHQTEIITKFQKDVKDYGIFQKSLGEECERCHYKGRHASYCPERHK